MAKHRVAVLALDGSITLDLAIPCQAFGSARTPDGQQIYDVRVCGPRHATVGVRDMPLFRAAVPWPLEEALNADTIVVPGVLDTSAAPPKKVLEVLRTAARNGVRIASVCTGAFVLAAAGLLDGHRATTHWEDAPALAQHYPEIDVDPDVLYVDNDGVLLTSA